MSNLDFDQLFSFTAADALAVTESKKTTFVNKNETYRPSIKDEKCADETYRALVRFIPFVYEGTRRTIIERWECYLKDVNGENGVFVVSPKTIKKNCPMRTLSWKLHESENAIDKANSKKINVYQQWYALVEIVKDVQHPDYEGKYMIYQFGAKIYDKIKEALEGSEYTDPINPFAFEEAPLFEIKLTKGNQKMDNGTVVANYDGCKFIQKTAPLHFGEGLTFDGSNEMKKAFIEWLEKDAPQINKYQWKEWSEELTEKVNTNLATYINSYSAPRTPAAKAKETINNIVDTTPTQKYEEPKVTVEIVNITDGDYTTDDDAWVDEILNS
jgi:hypothetical protein